jgi:hypothetical protein
MVRAGEEGSIRMVLLRSHHVSIRGLGVLSLRVDDLHELAHTLLHCLNNMCLKLSKGILDTNEVLAVVVLFLDLLVQAMQNTALQDVGIICGLHVAAMRVKCRRVLTEKFNVLLSVGSRLVNGLAALTSPLSQLFALVLDLGVQAFKNGENGAFQLLGRLVVLVGYTLGVTLTRLSLATLGRSVLGYLT